MYRWLIAVAAFVTFGLALAPPLAAADAAPIETFFGTFKGSGIAENSDSLFFGVTVRDFDVEIGSNSTGFKVSWTAIIRGGGDPAKPNVRRKTLSLSFAPSSRANVFGAVDTEDPMSGEPFAWARIDGQTAVLHLGDLGLGVAPGNPVLVRELLALAL